MTNLKYCMVRFFFFLMSIQVILVGTTMPIFTSKEGNKFTCYSTNGTSNENGTKIAGDSNQILPDEDDSSEQTETYQFSKIVDQENSANFEFNFSSIELVKFLLFNSKDKILFTPEFTTPPPKHIQVYS